MIDRSHVLVAWQAYVSQFDAGDLKIRIKIEHTLRVAGLCERIGASIGLDQNDIDIVWLCGMLHDIGRFEQIRDYGTFSDAKSYSHAAKGVQVLFEEGLIRAFLASDELYALVKTVVGTHSDFALSDELDAKTRIFCDILRDADKIDILAVNAAHTPDEVFGVTPEEMAQSPLSSEVVSAFCAHQTIRRELRKHPADYLVGFICFAYGLVYPESMRIITEQGHLDTMLGYEFTNDETAAEFSRMHAHLHAWLDEHLR